MKKKENTTKKENFDMDFFPHDKKNIVEFIKDSCPTFKGSSFTVQVGLDTTNSDIKITNASLTYDIKNYMSFFRNNPTIDLRENYLLYTENVMSYEDAVKSVRRDIEKEIVMSMYNCAMLRSDLRKDICINMSKVLNDIEYEYDDYQHNYHDNDENLDNIDVDLLNI